MKIKFFLVIFSVSIFNITIEAYLERFVGVIEKFVGVIEKVDEKDLLSVLNPSRPLLWATIGSAITYIGSGLYHQDMGPTVKKCLLTGLIGSIGYYVARKQQLYAIKKLVEIGAVLVEI